MHVCVWGSVVQDQWWAWVCKWDQVRLASKYLKCPGSKEGFLGVRLSVCLHGQKHSGIGYGIMDHLATSLSALMRVSEMVCTSEWSQAVPSGTCKSRSQQLGKLEFRDSYWIFKPSCHKDKQCTYMYLFPLTNFCPVQPERAAPWGHWCCLNSCECSVCLSGICVASPAYYDIYEVYVCSLYVSAGNTFSVLLQIGHGSKEL